MLYELTILSLQPNTLTQGLEGLKTRLAEVVRHGRLLGCFRSEFGVFNRVAILAGYESKEALMANRAELLESSDPYGIGQYLASIDRSAFKPFHFMPPVEPGNYGPFYEIRTYGVAWGAMEPTIAAWADMIPRREKLSKLLMVMESLETAPKRMVHIWPYASLDERNAVRGRAISEGVWPPNAKPEFLVSMQTELFLPTPFSPLT